MTCNFLVFYISLLLNIIYNIKKYLIVIDLTAIQSRLNYHIMNQCFHLFNYQFIFYLYLQYSRKKRLLD